MSWLDWLAAWWNKHVKPPPKPPPLVSGVVASTVKRPVVALSGEISPSPSIDEDALPISFPCAFLTKGDTVDCSNKLE